MYATHSEYVSMRGKSGIVCICKPFFFFLIHKPRQIYKVFKQGSAVIHKLLRQEIHFEKEASLHWNKQTDSVIFTLVRCRGVLHLWKSSKRIEMALTDQYNISPNKQTKKTTTTTVKKKPSWQHKRSLFLHPCEQCVPSVVIQVG